VSRSFLLQGAASALSLTAITLAASNAIAAPADYFVIEVVDATTGRGVPLIELETVNRVIHLTDSAGIIAFNEPGFMNREVYFNVRGHGYQFRADALGNRGLKLTPRAGERATVKIARHNVAERLYRLTGAGIYRDSVLAGLPVPLREPTLNAQVLGQDTVIVTPYRGKLYWFWGDTDQVSYPLGNFAASGATSELPTRGGLSPVRGVDFTYFTGANGFAKSLCPEFGPGLQWIESVFTVPDDDGRERLIARVSSQHGLRPPHAWHLAVFNDEKQIFESKVRWPNADMHDSAHPFRARVDGVDYWYLYPDFRVRADWRSVLDPTGYEALTCLAANDATTIDRDARGAAIFRWRHGADRMHEGRIKDLLQANRLRPQETWRQVVDVATGRAFLGGRGSVFWNDYRKRWIWIMAAAVPGEVWFAEADTPLGPWSYARRIVTHDSYNFYNVTQHPFFDEDGGRQVYFEGTYTESFSNAKIRTPRYDYNQIMYRLSLDDARVILPQPIYEVTTASGATWMDGDGVLAARATERIAAVAWHAYPSTRAPQGTIAIHRDDSGRLSPVPGAGSTVAFHALPLVTAATQGIAGRWLVRASDPTNAEVTFPLDIRETADGLRVTSDTESTHGTGTDEADRLTLSLQIDDHRYSLAAKLDNGVLRGTWSRVDQSESGTWTAQRVDPTPEEFRSPAVVALHEHRRARDGVMRYSTEPDLTSEGFVRSAQPICRVWRSVAAPPVDVSLFGRAR
jgi:hypothetical protein